MAASRIEKPVPFAEWIKTKTLFDDHATKTETHVTDGHKPGTRYAYGKSSEGWCFYIVMTTDEEPAFKDAYNEWLKRTKHANVNHRMTIVNSRKPPSCGTPDTPPCPDATGGQEGLLGLKLNANREQAA